MGVVNLVCDDGLRRRVREQRIGAFKIVGLPRCEYKARRIAQRIDRGGDLGAQPAPAAPYGLFF